MKKLFLLSALFLTFSANAATPWWLQPTVCRLNPTNCYTAMGAGFDSEMWDADAKCWGLKLICPDALVSPSAKPVAMGRNEINNGTNINPDYDTNILSLDGECFGRRKIGKNDAMVSVNGKYVNVYCPGILNKPDEFLENGEIMYNTQPTCSDLARHGYIAVKNNDCYGKYYDIADYFIECGTDLLPERIIVLNGADYNAPSHDAPTTMDAARQIFDKMYTTSKIQHDKYFQD